MRILGSHQAMPRTLTTSKSATTGETPSPAWHSRLTVGAALVLAVAISGCSTGPLVVGAPRPHSTGPVAPPSLAGQPPGHTATAPRGLRSSAELDVVSGAATLSVSTARLGGDLLRVSTPADSGVRPDLVIGHAVQLYLDSTGGTGPAAVQVVLNSAVTWRLLFAGGASQTSADLGDGRLGGADFAAGSSLISLNLPRPSGTVTLELAGGASQVSLGLPPGVPAQLRLTGGAASANLLGQVYTGIAGGTVLTSPGWAQATARYLIDAPAGVSSIKVSS